MSTAGIGLFVVSAVWVALVNIAYRDGLRVGRRTGRDLALRDVHERVFAAWRDRLRTDPDFLRAAQNYAHAWDAFQAIEWSGRDPDYPKLQELIDKQVVEDVLASLPRSAP